jgi:S-DNA-T family DNA segregation ATPase FtsK/SpoIIIE
MTPAIERHLKPVPDQGEHPVDLTKRRPPGDHRPPPVGEVAVREPVTPVLEGEILSADRPAAARVATIRAVVTDVAAHSATRTAARHVLYVADGAGVVVRRAWESRTTATHRQMIRAAVAAGNHERALEWEERMARFRRDRHDRRMELFALPVRIVSVLPQVALGTVGALVGVGVLMAVATKDPTQIQTPIKAVAAVVRLVAVVIGVAWGPLVLAAPWLAAAALWSVGRRHAESGVGWAARLHPDRPDAGMVVTADAVVLALQHLPIGELKKAFKDSWQPTFQQIPVRDGRGYHLVCSLPLGVTAEMVADQRPVLARNLHRAEIEVWPSDAEKVGTGQAGDVDIWIADKGALSKPAPEYPLLHEGAADVFAGVPAGVSPRGDAIMVPVVSNNFVAGGQMGQGKSNACRVVMLGCALDPLADLGVFVFAANGDFDAYRPRLARYHRGIDDETANAGRDRLRELYAEVGRREDRLAELGAKKVTRGLAEKNPDLRPIVDLFSECHELFEHPEVGEECAELATKTMKRSRKTAITMMFDTQSSRKEAIPPKLVELVSVNCCFYVKTWRSNDGFLGDGCFQAGIRATELRPGRDRGTSLIIGVSDAPFELLKWYFVEVDDDTGFDAAEEVIARAVAQLAPGTAAGGTRPEPVEDRDLLADLDEVLGRERVRLADVPATLRRLAPRWAPYEGLTGVRLRDLLEPLGVRVVTTGNVLWLDPERVREARRASE